MHKVHDCGGRFFLLLLLGLALLGAALFAVSCARKGHPSRLETPEGRVAYIASFGWEAEAQSEEYHAVTLPRDFDRVLQSYNLLQRSQGYDLSLGAGRECAQYTYTITNYPNAEGRVLAVLYILDGRVIGADIHTAEAEGFLHALKR